MNCFFFRDNPSHEQAQRNNPLLLRLGFTLLAQANRKHHNSALQTQGHCLDFLAMLHKPIQKRVIIIIIIIIIIINKKIIIIINKKIIIINKKIIIIINKKKIKKIIIINKKKKKKKKNIKSLKAIQRLCS